MDELQIQFKDKKWNINIERKDDIIILTHLRQEKVFQKSEEFLTFSWKLILTFHIDQKVSIQKLRIEFDKIEEINFESIPIEDLTIQFQETFEMIKNEYIYE